MALFSNGKRPKLQLTSEMQQINKKFWLCNKLEELKFAIVTSSVQSRLQINLLVFIWHGTLKIFDLCIPKKT
jgi:hypothetical protein